MIMTAMLVMYMIVTAISTMLMMMIMGVIVTAARPIRRMLMMVVRGREQVERAATHIRTGAHR